jgi:hypothetical protein
MFKDKAGQLEGKPTPAAESAHEPMTLVGATLHK